MKARNVGHNGGMQSLIIALQQDTVIASRRMAAQHSAAKQRALHASTRLLLQMQAAAGLTWAGSLPLNHSMFRFQDSTVVADLILSLLLLLQATLSSKHYMRGERFDPSNPAGLGFSARAATQSSSSSYSMPAAAAGGPGGAAAATMAGRGRSYSGARAAYGDYQSYPEGRPIFLPEAERFGNPPDLPSLLLQQRVIYISMPVRKGFAHVLETFQGCSCHSQQQQRQCCDEMLEGCVF
jgi:hypothetical protein